MPATEEIKFEITLTTPAFAGWVRRGTKPVDYLERNRDTRGYDTRSDPAVAHHPVDPGGIRVPSLRGVLEFWHRSRLGDLSGPEVFASQRRVFGSADSGQGLVLRPVGRPEFHSGPLRYDKDGGAMVYLGYGPLQFLRVPRQGRPDGISVATSYNRSHCRDAILVGPSHPTRFRFAARGNKAQREELQRALTLLHLFGGIGARSRRGWGSVMVPHLGVPQTADARGLKEWFEQTARAALVDPSRRGLPAKAPPFTAFSAASRAFLTKVQDGYEAVLSDFFSNFQRVRSFVLNRTNTRHTAVKDHALETADAARGAGAVTDVPARLAFGMPYSPHHPGGWSIEYRGRLPARGDDASDDVKRRGSPLLLKVFRLADGRHVGVALFLESSFFGDPGREIGAKGATRTRPFPGYRAVTELLDGSGWTEISLR
jgi:CRISPR-associated protein Cmr1